MNLVIASEFVVLMRVKDIVRLIPRKLETKEIYFSYIKNSRTRAPSLGLEESVCSVTTLLTTTPSLISAQWLLNIRTHILSAQNVIDFL